MIEAPGGREAVRLFEECDGAVDLVLTDVVMPHMGGRELGAQLRARKPSIQLLYMSGYADSGRLRPGEGGAGEDAFIQKPFSPELLLDKIHRMISGATNTET